MKKTKKQLGFAHLLIITFILGIGLVGALGYTYYQNFVVKTGEPTSAYHDKTSTPNGSKLVSVDNSKDTFKIAEFNIKGSYKGSHPLTYKINTGQDAAYISSSDLSSDCSDGVAKIVRLAPSDDARKVMINGGLIDQNAPKAPASEAYSVDDYSDTHANKHVGGYYYYLVGPAQYCVSSSDESVQESAFNDVMSYFKTLEVVE